MNNYGLNLCMVSDKITRITNFLESNSRVTSLLCGWCASKRKYFSMTWFHEKNECFDDLIQGKKEC